MRIRVFFDLDGTLNKWEDNPIEEVAKKGYFISREPVESMIHALSVILAQTSKYEVFILSSVFQDNHSIPEKWEWNALYTHVPEDHQIYVPYGQSKSDALQSIGGIYKTDVLIDDFSYNLKKWTGIAIKVYNGVNGTKGTWNGYSIRNNMEKEHLAIQLMGIIDAAVAQIAA